MLRRRLVALVVLTVLPLIGTEVSLGASPASAKTVTARAPRVSPQATIGTEPVTLSGSVGRSVRRTVRLERRVGGRWHLVARHAAGPRGRYSFRVAMPGGTAAWRVVAPAVRKHGKRYSRRASRMRTAYSAIQTAYASTTRSVRVGTPTTVSLSFAPARPGRAATLQVDAGSGWRTVSTLAQDRTGRAAYRYTPTDSGVVRLRAVAGAYHGAAQVAGPATELYVLPTQRMRVAAHRGFSSYYPENTLLAYSGALNQVAPSAPADWLETDFQQTADKQWIALHDADFARTTNVEQVFPRAKNPTKYDAAGRPLVDHFTLAEIKQLDAGAWKGKQWAGLRVPTLEETLDLVSASRSTTSRLLVEPKLGTQQEALDLYDAIRAYDQAHEGTDGYQPFLPADPTFHEDRAVFDTFNIRVAQRLVADRPAADVALVADDASEASPSAFPQGVATLLADSLVTRARVAALQKDGRKVIVWTVNKQDRWLELAALGVDAVITDNPKQARVVLTGTE